MRLSIRWLIVLLGFQLVSLAAERKNKEAVLLFKYDISRLQLDRYIDHRQRAALAENLTLLVTSPIDFTSFRTFIAPIPNSYQLFAFPVGYGLDLDFLEQFRTQQEAWLQEEARRNRPSRIGGYPDDNVGATLGGIMAMLDRNRQLARRETTVPVSALVPLLENELLVALSQNNQFQILAPPAHQEADLFLISSVGTSGHVFTDTSFSGREWGQFITNLLGSANSIRAQEILGRIRQIGYQKNELLIPIVTNISLRRGPSLVAGGYGVGFARASFYQYSWLGGYQKVNLNTQTILLDGIKQSVQDALNHLATVKP